MQLVRARTRHRGPQTDMCATAAPDPWARRHAPRAGTHTTAAPDPEGATARSLRRTRARRRCRTQKVRKSGPSGGQVGDGGARLRGHTSVAPQADTCAKAVPVPDGASAAPLEDTRAMARATLRAPARPVGRTRTQRRRPTERARRPLRWNFARWRHPTWTARRRDPQADTRATAAPCPEAVPAQLIGQRARRRHMTPRARRRGCSGGNTRDGGTRP